jgi:endoglucanase
LLTNPTQISEFGLGRNGNSALSSTWFQNTILYLTANDLDFAVWPLVGYLGVNWTDAWGLQNWDPVSGKRDGLYDGNDWRAALWTSLVNSTTELKGVVGEKDVWKMVNLDHDDQDQSFVMKAKGDWDSGARKGVCPDGLRLIGLSRGNRALCTNTVLGSGLWDTSNSPATIVNDQSHVTAIQGGDWASGYTKFQCPSNQFVIGYSVRSSKPSSVVCAPAKQSLAQGGSGTKWFDKGDNRPNGAKGGDWHSGQYKAQCEDDEYVAGLAFTTRAFSSPNPAALLCLK